MQLLVALLVQMVLAGVFLGVASLSAVWALLKGFKPRSVVLTGFFTMSLLLAFFFTLARADQNLSPVASFQQYFTDKHFEEEWVSEYQSALQMGFSKDKLDDFKDDYHKYFYNLLPSWLAAGSMVWGLLSYYLVSFILSRVTARVPKAMAFREWVLPEPLIFGLIGAGILKLVAKQNDWTDLLSNNLLIFFVVVYAIGGFSIVSFFLHKWRLPATLRVLSYLILVQLPLDSVCALGVLDVWFDFRKLKTMPREAAS